MGSSEEGDRKRRVANEPTDLTSASSPEAFLDRINQQLPECFRLIILDRDNALMEQKFNDMVAENDVTFEKCTYSEHEKSNGIVGTFLLYRHKPNEKYTHCAGGLEMSYGKDLDLYARTNQDFRKQSIYKFLIGVLLYYMGRFTNYVFMSDAVVPASSLVLKRFKQTTFLSKHFPALPNVFTEGVQEARMQRLMREGLSQRTKDIIRTHKQKGSMDHTIIPQDPFNLRVAMSMILYFLTKASQSNLCLNSQKNIIKQAKLEVSDEDKDEKHRYISSLKTNTFLRHKLFDEAIACLKQASDLTHLRKVNS